MYKFYSLNINELREPKLYNEALAKMSEDRLAKINKCKHEDDKLRSLAAGLLLDCGLSFYNLSLKNAIIELDKNDKPFIKDFPDIHFNLSHSGDMAVCVFDESPVGVDIERIKPVKASLVKYALSESEQQKLARLPAELKEKAFFDLWTEKEAFLKYLGIGIRVKLSDIQKEFENELLECNIEHIDTFNGYSLTICSKKVLD